MKTQPSIGRGGLTAANRRRARATVELVLTLPILIMMSLALIQFGVLFQNMQLSSLASRVGAEEASQTTGLPTTDGDPVPTEIVEAVEQQLLSSGIYHCHIQLEHNVGGTTVVLTSPADPVCECDPPDVLDPVPPGEYVRLTVCVPLNELMPNSLAFFGVSISDPAKATQFTTAFRYELGP